MVNLKYFWIGSSLACVQYGYRGASDLLLLRLAVAKGCVMIGVFTCILCLKSSPSHNTVQFQSEVNLLWCLFIYVFVFCMALRLASVILNVLYEYILS